MRHRCGSRSTAVPSRRASRTLQSGSSARRRSSSDLTPGPLAFGSPFSPLSNVGTVGGTRTRAEEDVRETAPGMPPRSCCCCCRCSRRQEEDSARSIRVSLVGLFVHLLFPRSAVFSFPSQAARGLAVVAGYARVRFSASAICTALSLLFSAHQPGGDFLVCFDGHR